MKEPRQGGDLPPPDAAFLRQADQAWKRFLDVSRTGEVMTGPFRISANLHYAGDEGTQRVGAYFWGNGDPVLPLRLDIRGGMGNILAAVREDERAFSAYVPSDKAVYFMPRAEGNLLAFDVPLPFSLGELSLLFTGRYKEFFLNGLEPAAPPSAPTEQGGIRYTLQDLSLGGSLILSPLGLPLRWSQSDDTGWMVTIEYAEDSTRTTPRRLRFTHASSGKNATVVVRDLARTEAFTEDQLELAFPPNTEPRRIVNQLEKNHE